MNDIVWLFGCLMKDYIKAQDWYRKAVAQGVPKAMAHLGTLLKHGITI
jgi:TPR repeat protein